MASLVDLAALLAVLSASIRSKFSCSLGASRFAAVWLLPIFCSSGMAYLVCGSALAEGGSSSSRSLAAEFEAAPDLAKGFTRNLDSMGCIGWKAPSLARCPIALKKLLPALER